ncbi:hypothetical protein U1Q18_032896 [Sarracenia purpurea var. burkii]
MLRMSSDALLVKSSYVQDELCRSTLDNRRPGENLLCPGEAGRPYLKLYSDQRNTPPNAQICSWNLNTELRARPPLFGYPIQTIRARHPP